MTPHRHRTALQLLSLFALTLATACQEDTVCHSSGECAASQVCVEGSCREACNSDLDCRGYEQCLQGACLPRVDAGEVDAGAPVDAGPGDRTSLDRSVQDQAIQDTARPDLGAADTSGVDRSSADATVTDAAAPDAAAPDAAAPDVAVPDAATALLDTAAPDTAAPDTAAPDTAAPDTAAPDTAAPDSSPLPCEQTCDGCCAGQTCLPSAYSTCGVGGAACASCTPLGTQVDSCSEEGLCVCAASGAVCSAPEDCVATGCCHPTDITLGTPLEFDPVEGRSMELAPLESEDAVIFYRTSAGVGAAAVMTAHPHAGTVTMGSAHTFGAIPNYMYGALERVDDRHYLAAYNGEGDDGYAAVLEVNSLTGLVESGAPYEFDTARGVHHGLAQIDESRVLVVYDSNAAGKVALLTVDVGANTVSSDAPQTFDTMAESVSLVKVDASHYLAAYRSTGPSGHAVVFEVDLGTNAVSWGEVLVVEPTYVVDNTLQQISASRFLHAFGDVGLLGQVRMLEVDVGDNSVTVVSSHTFGPTQGDRVGIAPIGGPYYLLAYRGLGDDGWVQILSANAASGLMASSHDVEYEPTFQRHPKLLQIDPGHILCAYEGPDLDGFALIIEPPCALP